MSKNKSRITRFHGWSLLIAIIVCISGPGTLLAASGALDTSFSKDGIVLTSAPGSSGMWGGFAADQSDGKTVVVTGIQDPNTFEYSLLLARYKNGGALDKTFGVNGKVIITDSGFSHLPTAVRIQSDGKIVVSEARCTNSLTNDCDQVVHRFRPNGTLDGSFGSGGVVVTDFQANHDFPGNDMVILATGQIIVPGQVVRHGETDASITQYREDGSLDTSFSDNGMAILDLGGSEDGFTLAVQQDGKLLLGGHSIDTSGIWHFFITRFNSDGRRDLSFGDGGTILSTGVFGHIQEVFDIAVQPDGKILASYEDLDFSTTIPSRIARFLSSGAPDISFGVNGIIFPTTYVAPLAVQDDGKILAAGVRIRSEWDTPVFRFKPNGDPDTIFGKGGMAVVHFAPGSNDRIGGLVLRSDGKIVVSGLTCGAVCKVGTARFLP